MPFRLIRRPPPDRAARRNVYLTSLAHSSPANQKDKGPDPTRAPQSLSLGRENDRKVRARCRLHIVDGLSKRPAGHVLQLHPDGLLAVTARVPDFSEPAPGRWAGSADPGAIWPPENRIVPGPGERPCVRRHRGPASHGTIHRRRYGGRGPALDGPARPRAGQHVLHDGRGPDAVHEGDVSRPSRAAATAESEV